MADSYREKSPGKIGFLERFDAVDDLTTTADAEALERQLTAGEGSLDLIVSALASARNFAEQEVDNRSCAGGSMSDYINEAQEVVDACNAALAVLQHQGAEHG